MRKRLPLFLILLVLYAFASAQNPADTAKVTTVDSATKKQLLETVKQLPSDSVLRQRFADSIARRAADSITKRKTDDSLAKLHAIDSAAKLKAEDSLAKQRPADSLAKKTADTLTKHTPADPDLKKDSVAKVLPVAIPRKVSKKDTVGIPSKKKVSLKPVAPAAELKHSTVRTLSDKKYNGYLNGEDMDDMSMVAEMNNYPLPDKALKYKVQLGLNPGQIMKLKAIDAGLHRKRLEMGDNIIRNEKMLDSLFHSHRVVDGTIIFYTNRYGLYQGELRNAILQACYQTEAILSVVQIKKLESLLPK